MQNQFICSLIYTHTKRQLSDDYFTFWYLLPVYDSYDAMGCVLMGGEI